MSVLIKGMDFPKNCDCCKFQRRSYDTFVKFCQFHVDNIVNDIDKIIKQREPNCPLTEVIEVHNHTSNAVYVYWEEKDERTD